MESALKEIASKQQKIKQLRTDFDSQTETLLNALNENKQLKEEQSELMEDHGTVHAQRDMLQSVIDKIKKEYEYGVPDSLTDAGKLAFSIKAILDKSQTTLKEEGEADA